MIRRGFLMVVVLLSLPPATLRAASPHGEVEAISKPSADVALSFVKGGRVVEVPVVWFYGEKSKISPLRDTIQMTREILQVRINAWRGRYDGPRA